MTATPDKTGCLPQIVTNAQHRANNPAGHTLVFAQQIVHGATHGETGCFFFVSPPLGAVRIYPLFSVSGSLPPNSFTPTRLSPKNACFSEKYAMVEKSSAIIFHQARIRCQPKNTAQELLKIACGRLCRPMSFAGRPPKDGSLLPASNNHRLFGL